MILIGWLLAIAGAILCICCLYAIITKKSRDRRRTEELLELVSPAGFTQYRQN